MQDFDFSVLNETIRDALTKTDVRLSGHQKYTVQDGDDDVGTAIVENGVIVEMHIKGGMGFSKYCRTFGHLMEMICGDANLGMYDVMLGINEDNHDTVVRMLQEYDFREIEEDVFYRICGTPLPAMREVPQGLASGDY